LRRKPFWLALALLGGMLVASCFIPFAKPSLQVSRWGETVRLLPSGLRFSPWFLASRWPLEREGDLALLPAQLAINLPSTGQQTLWLRLGVRGSGKLPLPASRVRQVGLEKALGEAIGRSLPPDFPLWQAAEAWTRMFPTSQRVHAQATEALRRLLAPLSLETLQVSLPDDAVLRAEGRALFQARASKRGRLLVLGWDALDWQLVDELVGKGLMPNLAKLLRGSVQAELEVPPPLISPVVWTTLATGQPPEVHGVLDFLEPDPEGGPPHPVSAHSRKVPALWEMLAAAGQRVAVIGWWATFPAQAPPDGVVYSDRLTEQLLGLTAQTPGLADPPKAQEEALPLLLRAQDLSPEVLAPLAPVTAQELSASKSEDWDNPVAGLAKLVAATETVKRLTAKELKENRDALFVYLEGTDTVGHLFGPYRPPLLPGVDASRAQRFGPVVDRYMAQLDTWLGQLLQHLGPEDSLVLLSDHGFTWGADRPAVAAGTHTPTAVWWHRPQGVLLVRSPWVTPSPQRQRLQVLQVAPLLLALAGLPPAAEMPGNLPPWVQAPKAEPVNYLELLGRPQVKQVILPAQARAEELAKLRALGYLGGKEEAPPPPGTGQTKRPSQWDRAEARRLNNLASSLAAAGDKKKAEEVYRQAIAADPTYAAPHYNLALLLRRLGRLAEADEEFWLAVDLGIADPELTVVRGALDYREKGELARAEALFRGGLARFPRSVPLLVNAGVFFGELGKLQEAKALLLRAVELDPQNGKARRNLAVALAQLGDHQGAMAQLEKVLQLDPQDEQARQELARLRALGIQ